jgi:hypothetical protein
VISITTNADRVAKDLREYISDTGVSDAAGVRMASKSVTRTLLAITPPIKSLSPTESFAVQRQVGVAAVKRDLRRSFTSLEDLRVRTSPRNKKTLNNFQKALDKKDASLMAQLLTRLNYPDITAERIVSQATPELHNSLRRKGRVPPHTRGYFVFERQSLETLLDAELEALGRGKAGWLAGGIALGIPAPGWISRHGAPGGVTDQTARAVDPTFHAWNGVLYLYDFAEQYRLVDLALEREAGSLERQLVAKRAGLWNKKQ